MKATRAFFQHFSRIRHRIEASLYYRISSFILKIIVPVFNLKRIALQNGNTLSFIRAPLNVASNFVAFNESHSEESQQ